MSTIHVVDDDESFCIATERLLRAAGYEVRTYSSGAEFVRSYPARGRAGLACVLLDIHMPGPSGLDLQEELAKAGEALPAIFISGRGDIPASVRAMKAGAVDFLTKPVSKETLLEAVATALAQDAEARAVRETTHQARLLYETLTPHEQTVFQGVVQGKLNKQIASELGAAERTVKAYRREMMKKMRADSVAALVRLALQLQAKSPPGQSGETS